MRSLILAATLTAGATLASMTATPARADIEYPYCSSGGWGSGGCSFSTLQQCQAYNQGVGGWCVPNPRYAQSQRDNAVAGPRRAQRH